MAMACGRSLDDSFPLLFHASIEALMRIHNVRRRGNLKSPAARRLRAQG